ncbi:GA-binding protein subunit beta-1 [Nymphon striatum]|nr:GA-binding protein subunit beta-1 [Nymphon striatum]
MAKLHYCTLDYNVAVVSFMSSNMSLVDLGKKLLESAKSGESEDVTLLMTNGAPFTTDWEILKLQLGSSPLHLAAQNGHIDTVKILIRAGISRDASTKLSRTSLHLAAQEGHWEIVDFLLKSGADIEAKDMSAQVKFYKEQDPVGLGIKTELLLRNSAEVNVTNKFDLTPADIASDKNFTDIYQLIQNRSTLKENQSFKSNSDCLDGSNIPISDSTETVSTSHILEVNRNSKNYSNHLKSHNSKRILAPHSRNSDKKNTSKPDFSGIKLIQKDSFGNDASEIQASTSVLATLAALAEATSSSKAGNASDATSWLEANGITMLPVDNSTVVASALEGGQSLTLTEAGKLALGLTKVQANGNAECSNGEESITLHPDLSNSSTQKVITIVATDQSQIPSLVSSSTSGGPIYLVNADGSEVSLQGQIHTNGPPARKQKVVQEEKKKNCNSKDDEMTERERLQKELDEARRVAEEYKAQLQIKEQEAECDVTDEDLPLLSPGNLG